MKKYIIIAISLFSLSSFAEGGGGGGGNLFGFNVGFGFPYLSQAGLNYVHSSKMFSAQIGLNSVTVKTDDVDVDLSRVDVSLRWHPFSGSFFIGAAVGKQTLVATKEDSISGDAVSVEAKVTSNTLTPEVGWMWGSSSSGFFLGLDLGYEMPSGAKTTFTTTASSAVQATSDYQDLNDDVVAKGNKFGETAFPVVTFLRVGYLF